MADHELLLNGVGDDDVIFMYTGGEQEVPRNVKRVRIAENIGTILANAFQGCQQLIEVEGHDKLKKIKEYAFNGCHSLRWLTKMNGVIEIEKHGVSQCSALSELEFDKLEIIGFCAFYGCKSLRSINLPSVRRVGRSAFNGCDALTDPAFGEDLERIKGHAFYECNALRPLQERRLPQKMTTPLIS